MNSKLNSADKIISPEFQNLAFDILGKILRSADNPVKLGRYLAEQLRELTGARTIILQQCLHSFGGTGHRIVNVNPDRRKTLTESTEYDRLIELAHHLECAKVWNPKKGDGKAEKILTALDCSASVAVPLKVGDSWVGVLMLLDIPDDPLNIDSVTEVLDMLATVVALAFRNSLLYEKQEEIIQKRTVALTKEINERKQAAEALKESEEKTRLIFESVNDAIFTLDMEGNFLDTNKITYERLGYTREEMLSMNITQLDTPEFAAKVPEHLKQIINHSRAVFESAHARKDGTIMPVEVSSKVVCIDEKKVFLSVVRDITERKKAEEQLKLAFERFCIVLDSLDALVYVADMDTYEVLFVNKYGQEIWGDITGKTCWKALQSDQTGKCDFCTNKRLLDKKGDLTGVYCWEFQNTVTNEWYECRDQAIRWVDGRLVRMEIATKITERKQAEQALRESEEKYRNLVERASDGILILQDEIVKFANNRLAEILGYTVGEMINTHFLDYVHPDERPKITDIHKRRLQGENVPNIYELLALHKDGRKINLETNVGTITYQGKQAILAFNRDITERKQAEQALKESEVKYHDLYDNAPDMFCSVDAKTSKIIECNQTLMQATGYTKDEIIDHPIFDMYHPDSIEGAKKAFESFISTGKVHNAELQLRRKDGTKIEASLNVSAIRDEQGNILFSRSVWRDITDRKRAEEALAKHREHLEELVKERTTELEQTHEQLLHSEKLSAIGKLSASIAHEFNNPLFGIRNVLDGILRKVPLDKTNKEFVSLAIKESDRIAGLIRSLQDFNRPTSGVMAPMDIHQALDDIILLVNKELKTKNIKLRRYYAADMPKVKAVKDQIKQVILNVLNNAGEAITGDGGAIKISTKLLKENIAIEVHDTGVGIKREHMDKIFEPFFTTKSAVKGTGLGLSISYGIIKKHGGEIKVKSDPGKGATFTILLPRRA